MKILVTGGAGFIGSHLVEYFQDKAEVCVLDNLRSGFRKNIEGMKAEFIEASVLDRDAVRNAVKGVDYVFHLAALTSVPESILKPIETVRINNEGLLIVLEEAASAGVKKLCFSSSAAVYGDSPIMPKTENMRTEPKSPYAITKIDSEFYCDMFTKAEDSRRPVCVSLTSLGQDRIPKSTYASAIPIFTSNALAGGPLNIFGDGEQTRDFIFVSDVVAANVFFANNHGLSGIYNVASGTRTSINTLVKKIIKVTGSSSPVVYGPERSGDIKHSMSSIEKLLATGFHPKSDFDKELEKTISFFMKNKVMTQFDSGNAA